MRIIDKLDRKIRDHPGPHNLSGIIDRIKPFEKLLNWLPTNEFWPKSMLFENLTEASIEDVYYDNLPNNETMQTMNDIINNLQIIVSEWDKEAMIVPFGSSANGFMSK